MLSTPIHGRRWRRKNLSDTCLREYRRLGYEERKGCLTKSYLIQMIKELLRELESLLVTKNELGFNALKVPLPEKQRKSLIDSLDFFDQALYDLYSWRDGCSSGNLSKPIFDFDTTLFALQDVVKYKSECPFGPFSSKKLLLIFASEEDGLLFNHQEGFEYGKIHLYSVPMLSIENPKPYYDSLLTMLQTTIAFYENDIFTYNVKTNFIEKDMDKGIDIYNRYNPLCRYYDND